MTITIKCAIQLCTTIIDAFIAAEHEGLCDKHFEAATIARLIASGKAEVSA